MDGCHSSRLLKLWNVCLIYMTIKGRAYIFILETSRRDNLLEED